ncbi:hypothetical protein COU60_01775, partial [Candidatus Pacearchaeota archaeon CG10_big_fil_rev_8_21_14_0_10_34_76]
SNYVTNQTNISISGAGFEIMNDLILNSPPVVSSQYPVNGSFSSSSENDFSCLVGDLDNNLVNVTLYGDWGLGWHPNETKSISGGSVMSNFTLALNEGNYNWNCLANDDLGISNLEGSNVSLTVDLTAPEINSVESNISTSCQVPEFTRVSCNTTDNLSGIKNVVIESISASGRLNHTTALSGEGIYYSDILLNEIGSWDFVCHVSDMADNLATSNSNTLWTSYTSFSDLVLYPQQLFFSNKNPIESEIVFINASVHNIGCGNASNFSLGFFQGDFDNGGVQITNLSLSLDGFSNSTVVINWSAEIGPQEIFVHADFSGDIVEGNESNNKIFEILEITGWQEIYGDAFLSTLLANQGIINLSGWSNDSGSWNIFVVDKEAEIDWLSLIALGRNILGNPTSNDFSDIDNILDMVSFSDSVSNVFTSNGNDPISTDSFFISGLEIANVPVVNSTNNSNFVTGILWDPFKDVNGEYDILDKEDVVFVTKVNNGQEGAYGIYDYEIKIPVRLREYYPADSDEVYVYFDLA